MSFQLNQDLNFFNWNKLFFLGGGAGGVTLAAFIILMSETSVLLGPF